MSYDLAVWNGPRPQDDELAGEVHDQLTAYFDDDDIEPDPATPPIRAFVEELLERYPGLGTPGDEDSPWAVGPEPGDVNGDFVYLTMTFSGARRSLEWIVEARPAPRSRRLRPPGDGAALTRRSPRPGLAWLRVSGSRSASPRAVPSGGSPP